MFGDILDLGQCAETLAHLTGTYQPHRTILGLQSILSTETVKSEACPYPLHFSSVAIKLTLGIHLTEVLTVTHSLS